MKPARVRPSKRHPAPADLEASEEEGLAPPRPTSGTESRAGARAAAPLQAKTPTGENRWASRLSPPLKRLPAEDVLEVEEEAVLAMEVAEEK